MLDPSPSCLSTAIGPRSSRPDWLGRCGVALCFSELNAFARSAVIWAFGWRTLLLATLLLAGLSYLQPRVSPLELTVTTIVALDGLLRLVLSWILHTPFGPYRLRLVSSTFRATPFNTAPDRLVFAVGFAARFKLYSCFLRQTLLMTGVLLASYAVAVALLQKLTLPGAPWYALALAGLLSAPSYHRAVRLTLQGRFAGHRLRFIG